MAKKRNKVSAPNSDKHPDTQSANDYVNIAWVYFLWLAQHAFKVTISIAIFALVIAPAIGKSFPIILNEIVFLHRLCWPPFLNASDPVSVHLNYTRNFRLTVDDGADLGAWHVLPEDKKSDDIIHNLEMFESSLNGLEYIVLYLHGNGGTRAGYHRVQLYKVLSRNNFHVLTLDYRGYADSVGYPTQSAVVKDAYTLYKYIHSIAKNPKIVLWGHSLGSGIATLLSEKLCELKLPLKALVLEAPYDNIVNASIHHPFSKLVYYLPWFSWVVLDGLKHNGITFPTDQLLGDICVPTLILHAEDDLIIPFELGHRLYNETKKVKKDIQFVSFPAEEKFGHKHIHKAVNLPHIIREFLHI